MAARLRNIAPDHALAPLVLLFAINGVDELDAIAFSVLLPEIREAFDLSLAEVGAIAAAAIPLAAAAGAGLAYLGDRRSRTTIAGLGLILWALCTGLTGLAWAVPVLVLARIAGDIGRQSATTHPSLLADWYREEVRSRVFYAYGLANPAAALVGPALVGLLAALTSWRVPFVVLVLPAVALGLTALRRPEPRRGALDRLAAGASVEVSEVEERTPGFGETYRVLATYPSIRRFWTATPFFLAGSIGFQTLVPSLLADELGLSVGERGLVFSAVAPGAIAGMLFAAPRLQTRLDRAPDAAGRLIAVCMAGTALASAAVALAPWLALAIVFGLILGFLEGAVGPGLVTLGSLVIPSRMRTLGLALGSLFALLGLAALPVVGAVADRYGIRTGMVVCLPLFLAGAARMWQASGTLPADIRRTSETALAAGALRHRRTLGDAPLLSVRSLSVELGGTTILRSVDLDVGDGELIALVGTNGAGKSTLLRAIAGVLTPSDGSVTIDGHEVTGAEASAIAAMGVRLVMGGRGVGGDLTVGEQLRLAGWLQRGEPETLSVATDAVLSLFPALRSRWHVRSAELSGGEQQMLAVGEALVARPRLLLIDELSLGLAPALTDRLLEALAALHQTGTTIVLVEQSVDLAARIADRVVFLEHGEICYDGHPDGLAAGDLVRAVHLGSPRVPGRDEPSPAVTGGMEEALVAEGLVKRYGSTLAVAGIDLRVGAQEIVAIIGPNGAGKSTLLDLIAGGTTPDAGRMWAHGTDVTRLPPPARARLGVVRSDQHARLWPSLSVADALAVACERLVTEGNPLLAAVGAPAVAASEEAIHTEVEAIMARLGLGGLRGRSVGELSSGQRRLVELGVLLAARPCVVLLDEPSAGLAKPEVDALGARLRDLRDELATTMVVVAHDISLVRAIAQRVVVLDAGTVVADGPTEDVLALQVVAAAYLGAPSLTRRARRTRPLRAG